MGRAVRRRPHPDRHGPPGRTTRIVLATAHLDQNPFDNAPENLAAFCLRCHILQTGSKHLRRRQLTYLAWRALRDLFTGPYGSGIVSPPDIRDGRCTP